MAQVLVRGLGDDVVETLKERARANGRSLEAELRTLIEQAAGSDIVTGRALAARIRRSLAGRTQTDSTDLVAEDRRR